MERNLRKKTNSPFLQLSLSDVKNVWEPIFLEYENILKENKEVD